MIIPLEHKGDAIVIISVREGGGISRARAVLLGDEQRRLLDVVVADAHSITSSARYSSAAGTVRPSALAVWRLITSTNFVGAWTARPATGSSRWWQLAGR